jgi:hypothetical protein
MGRELKRVRLDFNWPIDKVWHGYLNPFYKYTTMCVACKGRGESPESLRLNDLWYGYVPFDPKDKGSEPFTKDNPLIRASVTEKVKRSPEYYGVGEVAIDREAHRMAGIYNKGWRHHLSQDEVDHLYNNGGLPDMVHVYVRGKGWISKEEFTAPPTAKEVNEYYLTSFRGPELYMLHQYVMKQNKWRNKCSVCHGKGIFWNDPRNEFLSRRWKPFDPPKGDGFQLWETTSEGSPVSPVFTSLDELSEWCADNATTFGSSRASKESWKEMLGDGIVHHQEGNMIFI